MKEQRIIYYKDELNDEFSIPKIESRIIDEKYKYEHNFLWNICSYILQNVSKHIRIQYKVFR